MISVSEFLNIYLQRKTVKNKNKIRIKKKIKFQKEKIVFSSSINDELQ